MIRQHMSQQLDQDPHFRWRGEAVTRVENLSDIVFALALGMLVSASNVPTNFQEVTQHLTSIIPVAAAFAVLCTIWNAHFTFFRRYGLADLPVVFINAALLLVILYIAYPLRFIFDSLYAFVEGAAFGNWARMETLGLMSERFAGVLMGYFMVGYSVTYILITSLYRYAYRKADILELDDAERIMTRRSIWMYQGEVILSLMAAILALFTPVGPWAGFMLSLNWPVALLTIKYLPLPHERTKGDAAA